MVVCVLAGSSYYCATWTVATKLVLEFSCIYVEQQNIMLAEPRFEQKFTKVRIFLVVTYSMKHLMLLEVDGDVYLSVLWMAHQSIC